jgi:multicomponent K+:H+ antiporter subunit F
MLQWSLNCSFALVGMAFFFSFVRLLRGPDLADRILAQDTCYINALALVILGGIQASSMIYFEAAVFIALMGFVSTVAFAKFLLHGSIIS